MYTFKPLTELKVAVFDHTANSTQLIRNQLAAYKQRWNESLATNLAIYYPGDDLPLNVPIIVSSSFQHLVPSLTAIIVPTLAEFTHYHLRQAVIDPVVVSTEDPIEAQQWLDSLATTFAFDTETASILSSEEQSQLSDELSDAAIPDDSPLEAKAQHLALVQPLRSKLASSALVMNKNQTTMYSFADSESSAFVISSNPATDKVVLDFLTSTNSTVVMHNALFDMRLVYNRTGKFITNFEDTQLMYATIRNNTNSFLSKVGLKELAKHIYRDWAVSKDLFGIENKFNPELIHYSGVDACA